MRLGSKLGRNRLSRAIIGSFFKYQNPALHQKIWGIDFTNPVGLSAGFDKDAQLYPLVGSLGFGFAEIGTVTFKPYGGNPEPRLYRLPRSQGLVVNYGLKSAGAQAVTKTLKSCSKTIPLIVSVGRTNCRATAVLEAGIEDYCNGLKEFLKENVGDAYEINISCPNTFGGEPFTNSNDLRRLLQKLTSLKIEKPIFLKMPINLSWENFKKLLDVALEFKISAVTIGNLNKNRNDPSIKDPIPGGVKGSVSGKPTEKLSNNLITATYKYCGDKIKIIGVGGIFSAQDAYEKIKRGATLLELVTGMIYEGPQLISEINRGLVKLLKRDGYVNVSEAVGAYYR